MVWQTIYRIVGNAQVAQDCYQETFVAALQQAKTQTIENWPAMLRTLATRRAIDGLRTRCREQLKFTGAVDLAQVAHTDPPVEATLTHEELRQQVRELLADMPARQAEAFWMRQIDGVPMEQVAVELKTSVRNVSALVHRAATRLRAALRPQVDEVAP